MAQVLLIEPDRRLAQLYQRALEAEGHDVAWRREAQSAIHAIDECDPDIIILELHLVRHNGVEFLYEMRSYPEWDRLPVLLHTMVPPQHPGLGRAYWSQLGIVDYLYKPQTSLKRLIGQVNRLHRVAL